MKYGSKDFHNSAKTFRWGETHIPKKLHYKYLGMYVSANGLKSKHIAKMKANTMKKVLDCRLHSATGCSICGTKE